MNQWILKSFSFHKIEIIQPNRALTICWLLSWLLMGLLMRMDKLESWKFMWIFHQNNRQIVIIHSHNCFISQHSTWDRTFLVAYPHCMIWKIIVIWFGEISNLNWIYQNPYSVFSHYKYVTNNLTLCCACSIIPWRAQF